ncbi:formin-like protein 4, partial [Manacus vitellinus]|uniref:formin-like protein 4 n=1 Tax=Manacus vitellinus TaxID=328815 RepID=UPI00115EE83E
MAARGFRRDPDPHPAPAAPSRRAASRCGDRRGARPAPGRRAASSWAAAGHRAGQPPVSGPAAAARTAWRARRAALSPRSAPAPAPASAPASAPLAPAVPWRCYRGCAAAFPPRKRPTAADSTEIDPGVTKLREEKTKGLEAPSFPSVAVGVPDASGRTNPVAFMSNVLCCVCLQVRKAGSAVPLLWLLCLFGSDFGGEPQSDL